MFAVRQRVMSVGGCDIHFREGGEGEGRPLILLHGLSDASTTWDLVATRLMQTRRVIMPDLPGHGRSSRPRTSYDVDFYARTMATWLRAQKIEACDIVGHSLGGGVALRMLLEPLPEVGRLVLVSSGGLGREVSWLLRLCALIPAITTEPLEKLGQHFMPPGTRVGMRMLGGNFSADDRRALGTLNGRPGSTRALLSTLRENVGLRGQKRDAMGELHGASTLPPIAVFWGAKDRILPARHVHALSQVISPITVRTFENAGHYPHREAIHEFLPSLVRFLDQPQEPPVRAVVEPRPTLLQRLREGGLGELGRATVTTTLATAATLIGR